VSHPITPAAESLKEPSPCPYSAVFRVDQPLAAFDPTEIPARLRLPSDGEFGVVFVFFFFFFFFFVFFFFLLFFFFFFLLLGMSRRRKGVIISSNGFFFLFPSFL